MKNNPYIRQHLRDLQPEKLPKTVNEDNDSHCFLNLNINSLYTGKYVFYPSVLYDQLYEHYLKILPEISNCQDLSLSLKTSQLMFSQGSAEAIDLLIRAYCEPQKDSIIVTNPTFFYYAYRAKLENVNVIDIPLQGENYDVLNCEAITSAEAKLLFLCHPNNPVGTVLKQEQVELILQYFKGIVVLDEAYIEWSHTSSFVSFISKYDNLIVLRTFSKIWGLAGIRCGMVLGAEELLKPLKVMQTMFHFPSPCQQILRSAMDDISILNDSKRECREILEDLRSFLLSLPLVTKVFPSEANFLLVEVKECQKLYQFLLGDLILVKDNSNLIHNTLRISLGTKEKIERLKYYLIKFPT